MSKGTWKFLCTFSKRCRKVHGNFRVPCIAPAKFSTNFVASKAKTKQYFEAAKDLLYQPGQAEQTGKVLFSTISRLS